MYSEGMWIWCVVLVSSVILSSGARILVMMPNPAPSFTRSFQPLFRELANRGHQVTAYTTVPLPPPIPPHYREVLVDNIFLTSPRMANYLKNIEDSTKSGVVKYNLFLWEFGLISSEEILKSSTIQDLIHSDESFDLIIDVSLILMEPIAGFRHKFNCPSINLFPNFPSIMFSEITGNPQPYAYIPYHNMPYTDHMDLWQRMSNTIMGVLCDLGNRLYYLPQQDRIMRQHFNDSDMPRLESLLRTAHISFLDTHLLLDYPRPYLPGTVHVGGMITPKSKKLSKELKEWMDDTKGGFVYFSMGSVMKFKALSSSNRAVILNSFGRLSVQVLLKWEGDNTDQLPSNVRAEVWLPQTDILAHPNCRLFVTHAGMHSLMEALHYGMPLVGLPVFGDQVHNMVNLRHRGMAEYLLLDQLTEDRFYSVVNHVLVSSIYKDNALRLSAIVQDQLMTPLERAVYWVEYALRHGGAPHLQSVATQLSWYQKYLLDVALTIVFILCSSTFLIIFAFRLLCKPCFKKKKKD